MILVLAVLPYLFVTDAKPTQPPQNYRIGVPRFKTFERSTHEIYLGDKVKLSCFALATPKPTAQWFRNGELLEENFFKNGRFKENRIEMTLELKKVEVSDQGLWSCKVSNNIGSISRNFTIEIVDFCDYFLNYGMPQSSIPLECVCLWRYQHYFRTDIDFSMATSENCEKYRESIGRQQKRPLTKYLCYNPPCDAYGRPLSQPPPNNRPHEHANTKIDPVKLLDFLAENQVYDISHLMPDLIPFDQMLKVRELVRNWKRLSFKQKLEKGLVLMRMSQEHKRQKAIDEKVAEEQEHDDGLAVLEAETAAKNQPQEQKYNTYFSNFSSATEVEQAVLTPAPEVKPAFKEGDQHNKSIASPAGRTIRLTCKTSGYPEPRIAWHKNKALILADSPRVSGNEYKIRKWTLELEDTTEGDSGVYMCEVWNKHGLVAKSFNVTIVNRMRSPPFIVPNILQSQSAIVNSTVSFQCKVVSDLIPHIMWVKIDRADNGKLYYFNETAKEMMFRYTEMDTVPQARIIKNKDESMLIIESVKTTDAGIYACITGNSLGTSIANATLTVSDFLMMEIPTGDIPPEYSGFHIFLICIIAVLITVLLSVCISYFTCIKYLRRKREEDRAALLTKRKKIVVHKKQREDDAWSDLPSSYKITIEAGSSIVKKGRRPRLSSDMTLLDDYEVDTDPRWEIDRKRLEILEEIGSGAFGEVCKAKLYPDRKSKERDVSRSPTTSKSAGQIIPVAVKKVKPCATERDLVALVGEMEMFKTIGVHENVLRLVGCCTGVGPLYVVLELCEHGNLRDFLRAHRPKEDKPTTAEPKITRRNENGVIEYLAPRKSSTAQVLIENLTQRHLVEFAWQVAKGMSYMASKKIVHRDLAARNVLVARNFVMKISDFGLSRDVHYRDYYRKRGRERIPYKWMAIESLDENQISTIESDVWSFGILLWEIMTLGGTPYPTIAMQQLYNCLKMGYRMEAPHNCPEEIYRLMTACWQEKREKRPSFNTIVDFLEWMLSEGDMSDSDDYSPQSGGSSDDMDREDDPSSSPSEEEQSSAKRRHRPLSAPVNLPSDPQHDICDEDDMDDLPDEEAPNLDETDSLLPPDSTNFYYHYSVPNKLLRQHTDPTSDVHSDAYLEQRHISSIVAPSVDSAIGSPAWHLMDSHYSVPIDQSKPTHFYVNVGSIESSPRTKFPFPPHMTRVSQNSLADNVSHFFFNGKTNQAYMPSPNYILEDLNRRESEESSTSSGRGKSTESEDKIVSMSDYSSITDSHLPLRRLGDRKKSDSEQRRNAVGNLVQKLSGNL